MIAIVNVDNNWAIGKNNNLINRFKEDMNYFKNKTIGKTIIIGRKTLDSFPGGLPLKGRNNVVLTSKINNISREAYDAVGKTCVCTDGTKIIHSLFYHCDENKDMTTSLAAVTTEKDAVDIARLMSIKDEDIVVCGGASIYKMFLPYCTNVYVTKCNTETSDADAFFHNLDDDPEWIIGDRNGSTVSTSGIKYEFIRYDKVK